MMTTMEKVLEVGLEANPGEVLQLVVVILWKPPAWPTVPLRVRLWRPHRLIHGQGRHD